MCYFTLLLAFSSFVFRLKMELFPKLLPFSAVCVIISTSPKEGRKFTKG